MLGLQVRCVTVAVAPATLCVMVDVASATIPATVVTVCSSTLTCVIFSLAGVDQLLIKSKLQIVRMIRPDIAVP